MVKTYSPIEVRTRLGSVMDMIFDESANVKYQRSSIFSGKAPELIMFETISAVDSLVDRIAAALPDFELVHASINAVSDDVFAAFFSALSFLTSKLSRLPELPTFDLPESDASFFRELLLVRWKSLCNIP